MKRSFKLLLAAVAILAVLCSCAWAAPSAKTTTNVKYRADGVEHATPSDKDVYIIDDTFDPNNGDNMNHDWYVVQGHPMFMTPLMFTKTTGTNIILADDATLDVQISGDTAKYAVKADKTMTIYAQSTDRAKMGVISADATYTAADTFSPIAIYSVGDIIMHGGTVKARESMTASEKNRSTAFALYADTIAVGAEAVVEAHASANDKYATAIQINNAFISSGDVTATATAPISDFCGGIYMDSSSGIFVVAGGVCRATANGGDGSFGIDTDGIGPDIEGGWVESIPPMNGSISQKTNHTGGVLIDGDTGTVSGDAVIPAGMTATLREGVTLTVVPGARIVSDGTLVLPASMTKEQVKALNIIGRGEILKDGQLIHPDGEKSYDEAIAEASKMFGDESRAWTPDDGDWTIVISMDSTIEIDGVSIDGKDLTKDDDWSIKAASLGGISAKAETLSALASETAPSSHDLRITMSDDGYAILTFWVGTEKLPSRDDPPSEDDPAVPTRRGVSGACSAGAAWFVGLAALAMTNRVKR